MTILIKMVIMVMVVKMIDIVKMIKMNDDDFHLDRVSWEDLWGEEAGPHRDSSPLEPEFKKLHLTLLFNFLIFFNLISLVLSQ